MRILEIAGGNPSGFAGMVLASLGAEVVRIEPPTGRSFEDGSPLDHDEALDAYLHRRKRRIAIDLRKRAGATTFVELAATADGVIEDLGPGRLASLGLSFRRLHRANRNLVVASVSPFGQSGPRANWQSSELILQAMGGIVHSTGFEGEPGLRVHGTPAQFVGGIQAATALLAGILGVGLGTEHGVHIDISMEESWMHHWVRHIQQWAYSGHGMLREERGTGRQGFPHTVMTADGWLYVLALNADWEPFAVFLGLEEFAARPWNDSKTQVRGWEEIEPRYLDSLASKSRYDWFAGAAKMGYTFAPIHDAIAVVASVQAEARGAFEPLELGPDTVVTPRLPFAATMDTPRPNSVALPGADTTEILTEAGWDADRLAVLDSVGVIGRTNWTHT